MQDNLPYVKDPNLITSAKFLLPHKVTNSQVLGIRTWLSLEAGGSIILPTMLTGSSLPHLSQRWVLQE